MKPYTGGAVMPQSAETLVKKKHERIMNTLNRYDPTTHFHEVTRWTRELFTINSPQIDRRPKK